MTWERVLSATPGISRDSFAIRWSFLEMVVELDVSVIGRSRGV
jgi:hypothetical protein